MTTLGNALSDAKHFKDALSVREAELSMERRVGAAEEDLLVARGNLAGTYRNLGRIEEALQMRRDVYFGLLRLYGEEHGETLREAGNYANLLNQVKCFEEVKALLRKTLPVARRVLSESNKLTLKIRSTYAEALYVDPAATHDDLREAVNTLEETTQTVRRVFGGAHAFTKAIEHQLQDAQDALYARGLP